MKSNNKNIIIGTLITVSAIVLFLSWFVPIVVNFIHGQVQK